MRRHMQSGLSRNEYSKLSSVRRKEKSMYRRSELPKSLREASREAVPYGTVLTDWMSVEIECFYRSSGIRLIPFTKSHADGSIEVPQIDLCECDYPEECTGTCNSYSSREYIACFPYPRLGILERLLKKLDNIEADVNASCGLHVHLDVRHLNDTDFKSLVKKFEVFLPILMVCVAPPRWNNAYCKLGTGWDDRYYAINATSRKKHGTLEIRIHHGSVNLGEIKDWLKLLHFIKHYKIDNKKTIIETILDIPSDIREYIDDCSNLYGHTIEDAIFKLNEERD